MKGGTITFANKNDYVDSSCEIKDEVGPGCLEEAWPSLEASCKQTPRYIF